jgi:hypothetical protein
VRLCASVAHAALRTFLVTAALLLSLVPSPLRLRGGRESEGDREKSKELSHTNSALLTNFL